MEDDNSLDFNFWASFADTMLSLVLILVLLLSLVMVALALRKINLDKAKESQKKMVDEIARQYRNNEPKLLKQGGSQAAKEEYGISSNNNANYDIKIENDLNVQRIKFSDQILFESGESVITSKGKNVLRAVGETLTPRLGEIEEIQIEGHADNDGSSEFNINLAANRAIAVFEYFQKEVGIKPEETLMSATSYGKFKPVDRGRNASFDENKLREANNTEIKKDQNRRIEIVLIYLR